MGERMRDEDELHSHEELHNAPCLIVNREEGWEREGNC